MTERRVIVRVDATDHLVVQESEKVCQGQRLGKDETDATAPVSGIIQSIRFDTSSHEFVIIVEPA